MRTSKTKRIKKNAIGNLENLIDKYKIDYCHDDEENNQKESPKKSFLQRILDKNSKCNSDSSKNESRDYLREPRIAFDNDSVQWWILNKIKYPILSKIAIDYLAIPPTSVSSGRNFLTAGLTVTKTRTNLNPNTIKQTSQIVE